MPLFTSDMLASERNEASWIEGFRAMRDRTAMGPLGAEVIQIDNETATLEITITDMARQPMGLLHGGVSLLLAESIASFHSAWLADLSTCAPLGIDINGTHVGSAREGTIQACARVVRRAHTFIFHEIDITHVETGHVLCKARMTNFLKPHR